MYTTHPVTLSAFHTHAELFRQCVTDVDMLYIHHFFFNSFFFARAAPHLQVDKDCLHFLWTQDLLQWDHVVLETKEI